MTLASILTRLELMHSEISGLTVFKEPPRLIESDDCPVVYALSGGFEERQNSAALVMARIWSIEVDVLARPFQFETFSIDTISDGIASVHTLIDSIAAYYNNHRMMDTDASAATLNYILAPGMVIRGGEVSFPMAGPDSNSYFGTRFTLLVPLSVPVS